MTRRFMFGVAGLALAAAATPASAQDLLLFSGLPEITRNTQSFRAEALRIDAFEIESARIALQRSRDPRIRSFAREAIRDHQATTAALLPSGYSLNATDNVVSNGGSGPFASPPGVVTAPVTLAGRTPGGLGPTDNEPGASGKRVALDPRRQDMLNQLNATPNGRGLDQTYTTQQVRVHQEALALYSGYSQNGDDDAGRAFATQALTSLQYHLGQAVRLDARYGDSDAAF